MFIPITDRIKSKGAGEQSKARTTDTIKYMKYKTNAHIRTLIFEKK